MTIDFYLIWQHWKNLSFSSQFPYKLWFFPLFSSSANAKKWEVELTTLKNNNARLTSALQESTANVEEWKRQLNSYKEENSRLKMSLIEVEAGRGTYTYIHTCMWWFSSSESPFAI